MNQEILYAYMDNVLPKVGCGPFSLLILYSRYGSIPLHDAASLLKVSHITVNKFNKILLKRKYIRRSLKKDFELTDTAIQKQIPKAELTNIERTHQLIFNKILSHKRYSNNFYKKKKIHVLTKKIETYLKGLLKKLRGKHALVGAYCDWWIKNKTHLRFTYGLFVCDSLLEEFDRSSIATNAKRKSLSSKSKKIKTKKAMSKLEEEVGTDTVHRKTI